MKNIPGDLKFLSSHEWARVESDGTITIGISDHAQDLLGDIVFVELPEVGQVFDAEASASKTCPTSGNSTKTMSPKRSCA